MIRLYSVIIPVRFFYTPPIGARAVETCRNNRVICSGGCILDGNGPTRSHDFLLDKIDRSLNSAFSITPRNVYTATFKLMQFNEIHSATLSELIVVNDKLNEILLSFFSPQTSGRIWRYAARFPVLISRSSAVFIGRHIRW